MQGFSAMNATTKMMLTLVAMCLLMAAPAMGARNLLGAPHMSMHPAPLSRARRVCLDPGVLLRSERLHASWRHASRTVL